MRQQTAQDTAAAQRNSPLVRTIPARMQMVDQGQHGTIAAPPGPRGPLDGEERHRADLAARRLHSELRVFLGLFGEADRSASALARHLDLDRTTCQRAVSTCTRPYPGPGLIERLPGPKALRQLVDAAEAQGVAADSLDALRKAIDFFESTVAGLAGSQSKLVRRLRTAPAGQAAAQSGADQQVGARQRLFEAAAELTGRYSQCWVAVYIYWPAAGRSDALELARANGLVGHVARGDAVPLTFHNFSSGRDEDPELGRVVSLQSSSSTGAAEGGAPDAVLREFTTDPPPIISSKQPQEFQVQSIDRDPSTMGSPIDLMLASRSLVRHPAQQRPPLDEVWAMVNFPVRHMVFDVYLHRELARACIPSLDAHLWRPDFAQTVGDRWQTRFPDPPPLQLLGRGIEAAASPVHGRHAELTDYLFAQVEQSPDRFVGFRCAVDYPAWRTGYCMSFDYDQGEEE